MLLNISKLSIAGLALMSASALASVTTASFSSASNDSNNQFHVVKDGVTITVSGWSDNSDFASNPMTGDDKINAAKEIVRYGAGWGITNQDPDGHTADNYDGSSSTDYDMFLLEFSSAVNLSRATYSYLTTSASDTQVTVAALTSKDIDGKSWSSVKNTQTIDSGYAQMRNTSGYFTNFKNNSTNVKGTVSKYWLIGALNTAFGGNSSLEGNDGFKLSGVSFTKSATPPTTSVPEPTSIMMFGLALVGLFAANRRKIK